MQRILFASLLSVALLGMFVVFRGVLAQNFQNTQGLQNTVSNGVTVLHGTLNKPLPSPPGVLGIVNTWFAWLFNLVRGIGSGGGITIPSSLPIVSSNPSLQYLINSVLSTAASTFHTGWETIQRALHPSRP